MKSNGIILMTWLAMAQCSQGLQIDSKLLQDWQRGRLTYGHVPNKRSIGGFGGGSDIDGSVGDYYDRFLSIREAPPKRIEARQHGKVVLDCSAAGTPAPQITWFKDGRPLFKDGKHKGKLHKHGRYGGSAPDVTGSLGETKSQITLDCLDEEDAGLYECVATNEHSKKAVATQLDIVSFEYDGECKHLNAFGSRASSVKPVIHQWINTYMQVIGMDALLLCRAAGPHETYWMAPNQVPVDSKTEKYQMTATGDLIVRKLSFEDMGLFKCRVKNANGYDMIETFVYPLAAS